MIGPPPIRVPPVAAVPLVASVLHMLLGLKWSHHLKRPFGNTWKMELCLTHESQVFIGLKSPLRLLGARRVKRMTTGVVAALVALGRT